MLRRSDGLFVVFDMEKAVGQGGVSLHKTEKGARERAEKLARIDFGVHG